MFVYKGDARRSKLTIVNQNSGPDKISLYNNGQSQRQTPVLTQTQQQHKPKSIDQGPTQHAQQTQASITKPVKNFVNRYTPEPITTKQPSTTEKVATSIANFYAQQKKDDYSSMWIIYFY